MSLTAEQQEQSRSESPSWFQTAKRTEALDASGLGNGLIAGARHAAVRVCLVRGNALAGDIVEGQLSRGAIAAARAAAVLRIRGARHHVLQTDTVSARRTAPTTDLR